jgi:hypothetical protein
MLQQSGGEKDGDKGKNEKDVLSRGDTLLVTPIVEEQMPWDGKLDRATLFVNACIPLQAVSSTLLEWNTRDRACL